MEKRKTNTHPNPKTYAEFTSIRGRISRKPAENFDVFTLRGVSRLPSKTIPGRQLRG